MDIMLLLCAGVDVCMGLAGDAGEKEGEAISAMDCGVVTRSGSLKTGAPLI
jgi:hypothetical protein